MANRYYSRDFDRARFDPYYNDLDQNSDFYHRNYGYNRGYGMNPYRSNYNYDRGYGYGRYPYSNRGFTYDYYNEPYDTEWAEDYFFDETPDITYTEFWLIPGPFTGLSPQGYTRSDQNIKDDVNDRLTQHGGIDARNIKVDVNKGEVTLNGMVDSRKQKRMAEDVAESVAGVEDVHNHLKVQKQQQGAGIKNAIKDGMEVIGKNGRSLGHVKQIRANDFLLDRPVAKDVFVPFDFAHLQQDKVQLSITADQVEKEGWQTA